MNREEIAKKRSAEGVVMNGLEYEKQETDSEKTSSLTKWIIKAEDDGYTLAKYGCIWRDGHYLYEVGIWWLRTEDAVMLESDELVILMVTGKLWSSFYDDYWDPIPGQGLADEEEKELWDKRFEILSGPVEDDRLLIVTWDLNKDGNAHQQSAAELIRWKPSQTKGLST
jgi:hypothetical protein